MKTNTLFLTTMGLFCGLYFVTQSASAISSSCEYTGPPAPVKGQLIDTLRVMTMNVWGQNGFGPLDGDSETKCHARLKTIGQLIANETPRFDVVGLTEVHPNYAGISCDGNRLVKAIQSNGEYTGNKARWGHPETSWKDYDGGTSLFSKTAFDWHPYKKHAHRYTPLLNPRTAAGFIFARIQLKAGVELDVYVTHIHSTNGPAGLKNCNQQCKVNELRQLALGIHERSANSGNPVLVMGDFNIGGPNPTADNCQGNKGYGDIMNMLRNPRDVWLEAHPNNSGSTHSSERIDFMFLLTDSYFTNSPYELSISDPDSVRLLKWTMPGFYKGVVWHDGPFNVSDHFGIEATFEVRKRLDWSTVFTVID